MAGIIYITGPLGRERIAKFWFAQTVYNLDQTIDKRNPPKRDNHYILVEKFFFQL